MITNLLNSKTVRVQFRRTSQNRGAAIALLVIILVPLIGLLGLAIDAGIVVTSQSQLERSAQSAALASMSRYLVEIEAPLEGTSTERTRYITATTRALAVAENVLRINPYLGKGFSLRGGSDSPYDISLHEAGTSGTMEFGYYYPETPSGTSPEVLQLISDCDSQFPCFLANDHSNNATVSATSVRIYVTTGDGASANPLVPVFGKLLGLGNVNLRVNATATRVVQNLAFLVDLSSSVASTNHLPGGSQDLTPDPPSPPCDGPLWFINPGCEYTGTAANFAYLMDSGHTCNSFYSALTDIPTCCGGGSCLFSDGQAPWVGLQSYFTSQCDERENVASPSCPNSDAVTTGDWADPSETDSRYHSKRDYQVVEVDFGSEVITQSEIVAGVANPRIDGGEFEFLVDFASDPPGPSGDLDPCTDETSTYADRGRYFCAQPQPLLSILSSASAAIDYIEDRAVPGDRFMFSGFDEYLYRNRLTCATSAGGDSVLCPPEDEKLITTTTSEFAAIKAALNSATDTPTATQVPNFLTRGIFPRPQNTDGVLALWDAILELNQLSTSRLANNMIFLFTDGMFNCTLNVSEFDNLYSSGGVPSTYLSQRACANNGNRVWGALDSLRDTEGPTGKTLVDTLVESKVVVNLFLFGPGAHRLVRKSSIDGVEGCMTQEEAVYHDQGWIDSNADVLGCEEDKESCSGGLFDVNEEYFRLISGSGGSQFYLQNELFDILVRATRGMYIPILESLPVAEEYQNFSAVLEQACNDEATLGAPITNLEVSIGGVDYEVTDSEGRLLYDPFGQSAAEQISDAIGSVMEGGFILTEPRNL